MEAHDRVTYRVGDLLVDPGRSQVTRGDLHIPLPRLSFDLFVALIRASPDLVTHDELMAQVWPGLVVTPETVSQRAKLLRQSLGDDPRACGRRAGPAPPSRARPAPAAADWRPPSTPPPRRG